MKADTRHISAPSGGFRQSLFWDVDQSTIDPEKHARYIIERVLDFGNDNEVRWIFSRYSQGAVKQMLGQELLTLTKKSRVFWELVLAS